MKSNSSNSFLDTLSTAWDFIRLKCYPIVPGLPYLRGGKLDPQIAILLNTPTRVKAPPLEQCTPIQARHDSENIAKTIKRFAPIKKKVEIKSLSIHTHDREIPIRIYTPHGKTPHPVLLYFHGGGWVIGSIETVDRIAHALAYGADCIVVSVDYRLAPEAPFPNGLEDCLAAWEWVRENIAAYSGNPLCIAAGGDSAGGNLTAALALQLKQAGHPNLAAQVLLYPVVDLSSFDTSTYNQYGDANFGLTRADMTWYRGHYLPHSEDYILTQASPLLEKDLHNLPPAIIIIAEFDVLRAEAEAYAAALQSCGVEVRLIQAYGMVHGFFGFTGLVNRADAYLEETCAELRRIFSKVK